MHDWTLLSILFDWASAHVQLRFEYNRSEFVLVAHDVVDLKVPHLNEWGPSVSVNKAIGPFNENQNMRRLQIQMQSGDVIDILAKSFDMPF